MSAFDRRQFVIRSATAVGVAAASSGWLSACGSSASGTVDAVSGTDATPRVDAVAGDAWATGGTAAMTDAATYPSPFTDALTNCLVVASTTEGPCTTASDLARQDVSEQLPGLPVRLALKIVDASCAPLVGAVVKIWHTSPEGSYSGQTPNNGMCLKDAAYASQNFGRGVQTTDAQGMVAFHTVFPGWYSGRVVHIHLQVTQDGNSTKVSQVFFPADVVAAIFAAHPDYVGYGQPNTSLETDNVVANIPVTDRPRHIVDVARMTDGAMLASKVIAVVT